MRVGFFKQREQRDPSTRAQAARKHLATSSHSFPTLRLIPTLQSRLFYELRSQLKVRALLTNTLSTPHTRSPPSREPTEALLSCARACVRRTARSNTICHFPRRYRSAEAGHLGLRARVGPAGTQPHTHKNHAPRSSEDAGAASQARRSTICSQAGPLRFQRYIRQTCSGTCPPT